MSHFGIVPADRNNQSRLPSNRHDPPYVADPAPVAVRSGMLSNDIFTRAGPDPA